MPTLARPTIAAAAETSPYRTAPSRRARILVAIIIGEICGTVAWAIQRVGRTDWAQIWHGARALSHGVSPYSVVGPGGSFHWEFPLLYPLPAIVVGLPFALAPIAVAVGLFVGCSAALLAFGLTRKDWCRLLLISSAPCLHAVLSAQWSMLLTAAVLLPPLGFVLAAKPTTGAALWLYRPSRWSVVGGIVLVLASLAAQPSWPREWLATLAATSHMVVPFAHAGGPLTILALLRWRRPEARLLLALACVPQTALLYATLPLLLIPETLGESLIFIALSYVAFWWWHRLLPYASIADSIRTSVGMVVPLLYLPCLIMILRRPNEGELPPWIERSVARGVELVRLRLGA